MFYETKIVVRRIKELLGSDSESSMAKRLGIPQVTLNYCLAGKRKPSLELIFHICSKYDVSADWLLGLSEDRDGSQSAARQPMVTKKRQLDLEPGLGLRSEMAAIRRLLDQQQKEIAALKVLNQPSVCVG